MDWCEAYASKIEGLCPISDCGYYLKLEFNFYRSKEHIQNNYMDGRQSTKRVISEDKCVVQSLNQIY